MSVVNETTIKNWQAVAHSLKRLCQCFQNNNPNVSKNGFSILEKESHGLACACEGFLFVEVKNLTEVIIRVGYAC